MNTLVVFAVIIAAAMANPIGDLVSVQQDTLGNYKYSIEGIHGLSRVEQRNIPVTVSGYSYIDPILRKVPISTVSIEASPRVAIAKTEHLPILRNVEIVESPLIKEVEVPLVRSSVVEVPTSLYRVAAVPTSPEVLDIESREFAHHVALNNHRFI